MLCLAPRSRFQATGLAICLLFAQSPAFAELNLSSTAPTESVANLGSPVVIRSGGTLMVVGGGTSLTPAQAIAVTQVISSGSQNLVLNAQGGATGGTFITQPLQSYTVPRGVSAVHDFGRQGPMNVTGNFTNAGTFYAVSTNAMVANGVISAANIFNSGKLTTILPSAGLPGFSNARSSLDLTLNALGVINNSGTISSAGNLKLSAGKEIINRSVAGSASGVASISASGNLSAQTAKLTNASLIQSLTSDVLIAGIAGKSLMVSNKGGTIEALNGGINILNQSATKGIDTSVSGGVLDSLRVTANGGAGDLFLHVNELGGPLDVHAGTAHVGVSAGSLVLGEINITGDPTFYTVGTMTLTSPITVPEKLTLLATQDINLGGFTITATSPAGGHNITIIAGAELLPINGAVACCNPGTPTFGVNNILPSTSVKVLGPSSTGGNILCSGCTIDSSTLLSGKPGGNLMLAAYRGNPGTGGIDLTNSLINTSSGFGVKAGNITAIAPRVIGLGFVLQLASKGGARMTLTTADPVGILTASASGATTGTLKPSPISVDGVIQLAGDMAIPSGLVTMNAGALVEMLPGALLDASGFLPGMPGGTVQIKSGGNVVLADGIVANGESGSDGFEMQDFKGGNGTVGGAAGVISISAVGSLSSLGNVIVTAMGGTGGNGGEGGSIGALPGKVHGFAGGNGGAGGKGGSIVLHADSINLLGGFLEVSGGQGGNGNGGGFGSEGGNGGNGGNGGASGNAGRIDITGSSVTLNTQVVAVGRVGGSSGEGAGGDLDAIGGNGGNAGTAGKGGNGGIINITALNGNITLDETVAVDGGDGGDASAGGFGGQGQSGRGGNAGNGGLGGAGGKAGTITLLAQGDVSQNRGRVFFLQAPSAALRAPASVGGDGGFGGQGGNGVSAAGNGGRGGNAGLSGAAGIIKVTANSIEQASDAGIVATGRFGGNGGYGGSGGISSQGRGGNGGAGGSGSAPGIGGKIELTALSEHIILNDLVFAFGGLFAGDAGYGGKGGDGLIGGGNGGNAGKSGGGSLGGIIRISADDLVRIYVVDASGSVGAGYNAAGLGRGGDGGKPTGQVGNGGSGGHAALAAAGGAGGSVYIISKTSDILPALASATPGELQVGASGGFGSLAKSAGGKGGDGGNLQSGIGGRGGNGSGAGSGGKGGLVQIEAKAGAFQGGGPTVSQIHAAGGLGGGAPAIVIAGQNAFGGDGGFGNTGGAAGGASGYGGDGGAGGTIKIAVRSSSQIPQLIVNGGNGGGGLLAAGDGLGGGNGNGADPKGGAGLSAGDGGNAGLIEIKATAGSITLLSDLVATGGMGGHLTKDGAVISGGGNGGSSTGKGGDGGSAAASGNGGNGGKVVIAVNDGGFTAKQFGISGGFGGNSDARGGDGRFGDQAGGNGGKSYGTGHGGMGGSLNLTLTGPLAGDVVIDAITIGGGDGGRYLSGGGGHASGSRFAGKGGNVDGVGNGGNAGKAVIIGAPTSAVTLNGAFIANGGTAGGVDPVTQFAGQFDATPGVGGDGFRVGGKGGDASTSLRPGNGGKGGSVSVTTGGDITFGGVIFVGGGIGATPLQPGNAGGYSLAGKGGLGGAGGKGGNGGAGGAISIESKTGNILSSVALPNTSVFANGGTGGFSSGGGGGGPGDNFGGNGGAAGATGSGGKGGSVKFLATQGTITINGGIFASGGASSSVPAVIKGGDGGQGSGNGGRGGNSGNSGDGGSISLVASSPVVLAQAPVAQGLAAGTPGAGGAGGPANAGQTGGKTGASGTSGRGGKNGTVFFTSDADEFQDDEFLRGKKKRRRLARELEKGTHLMPVAFLSSTSGIVGGVPYGREPFPGNLIAGRDDTFATVGSAKLSIAKGSIVYIQTLQSGTISVMCLHDSYNGDVRIKFGDGKIVLRSGEAAVLRTREQSENQSESPMCEIAQRNEVIHHFDIGDVSISEFSLPSALISVPHLAALQKSKNAQDREVLSTILKNAAVLHVVSASKGPYKN